MKKVAFNLLSAASLLVCIAATAWDISSFFPNVNRLIFEIRQPKYDCGIDCFNGTVTVIITPLLATTKPIQTPTWFPTHLRLTQYDVPRNYSNLPLEFWDSLWHFGMGVMGPIRFYAAQYPGWVLVLLAAILPVLWMRNRIKRRPKPGICRICSYDLRATPDVCPECGTGVVV